MPLASLFSQGRLSPPSVLVPVSHRAVHVVPFKLRHEDAPVPCPSLPPPTPTDHLAPSAAFNPRFMIPSSSSMQSYFELH